MEFLRFGSSIPGSYWGCCACCIIQNFKVDPDAKASIQLVSGDGGSPVGSPNFAGPTWRDIFWQRLRVGTFDRRDMPNHAFLAIITENQISGKIGKAWLEILREAGFEFVRSVTNSVYSGAGISQKPNTGHGSSLNHIFGLFRNIGTSGPGDPFVPPEAWQDLPSVTPEAWQRMTDTAGLAVEQHASQLAVWNKIGPAKFLTEAQIEKAGAPVTYAGLRSQYPQQTKAARLEAQKRAGVKPQQSMANIAAG